MKRKTLFFSAIFILLLINGFIFIKSVFENSNIYFPPAQNSKIFLLGAMDNQTDWNRQYITKQDKFGMNIWSCYGSGSTHNLETGQHMPLGWTNKDSVNADSSVYFDDIKVFLNKNAGGENIADTMHSFLARPKITWLCYGQRSDYQCESSYIDDYYWLYYFQEHIGTPTPDSGGYVQYCQRNINQTDGGAGWVVKKLKSNSEMNNINAGSEWSHWDDSEHRWYIKPKIRIDSNFAHNYQTTPVCRIIAIGSNGDTLKNVVINAGYFLKRIGNEFFYNGQYLEEYNFPSGTNLEIQGAWGLDHYYGGSARGDGDSPNKTDIQVYWHGNCDMWLDYVRVDNDVANELFSGLRDPWIQWEATLAKYQTSTGFKTQYKFYSEELDFNNVPCIEYVNKKLQEYTAPDTVDLTFVFYWANFMAFLP